MPHRILHVTSTLDRFTAAAEMAAVAESLDPREFQQYAAVLGRDGAVGERLARRAIPLTHLARRWRADPTTLLRLASHCRTVRPRLVHAWDEVARRYAQLATRLAGRVPLVAEAPWRRPAAARWPGPPARWVAPSEAVVPPEGANQRWTVIPPGVACDASAASSAERPTSLRTAEGEEVSLPDDVRLIGVAAPLRPAWGVKELIWAADMVRVLHPHVRLLIVGDGPERWHLEQFARTAAVPENIVFLGKVDYWPTLAAHLDVYWHNASAAAGRPTSMLEAMAAGVPVVASDTPQHRELIAPDESGYLVAHDARAERTRLTDQLLTDADLAKRIGEAGRARVSREFSLAARVERYAALYRELLAS